jgi:hypothetical protein
MLMNFPSIEVDLPLIRDCTMSESYSPWAKFRSGLNVPGCFL